MIYCPCGVAAVRCRDATAPGLMIYGAPVETGAHRSLLPSESHSELGNMNKAWSASGAPLTRPEEEEEECCDNGDGESAVLQNLRRVMKRKNRLCGRRSSETEDRASEDC
ncbi:hypothetical protein AOLI_G00178230 [Acnodon oligacanthus]